MPGLSRLIDCRVYRLQLRSPFRGLAHREGVLLHGPGGWGEFAPFADYTTRQDSYWLAAAVEMAAGAVPEALRDWVGVNAILPDTDAADLADLTRTAVVDHGCRTVKLKVGAAGVAADVARLAAVRSALDDSLGTAAGRIRIDANGRWSPAQAIDALAHLADYGIEYVEQPCATADDIAVVRSSGTGVPIAVDEVLRRDRRFTQLADIADVAVVKVAPLGGGRAVLDLVPGLGVPVVISSALESTVGLSRDARVAAALPGLDMDCGLGTGLLLATDVVPDPLVPRHGRVAARLRQPDPAALERAAAPHADAWLDRMDAAWQSALAAGLIPQEQLVRLGAAA